MSSSLSYMEFLKRLRRERKRKGITQTELAGILGVSQGHTSRLARGKNILSAKALLKLKAKGFDLHYLLTGDRPVKTELNKWLEEHNIQAHASKPDPDKDFRLLLSLLAFCLEDGRREDGHEERSLGKPETAISDQISFLHMLFREKKASRNVWIVLRSIHGLNQKEMADELGVEIKKYARIESGKDLPDAELLIRAYEKWRTAPEILLGQPEGYVKELNGLWRCLSVFEQEWVRGAMEGRHI